MAAETAVSAVVGIIVEKLANEAFEQYTRSQGIHSELNELRSKLSHIQAQLNDASRKEATDESVRLWLNSLQHLAYDIHDVLDDVSNEATHRELTQESGSNITSNVRKLIPTWFTNFSLTHKLHLQHRLDSISKELEDLYKNIPVIDLIVKEKKQQEINTSRRNETSLLDPSSIVVGREGDIEKLLNKLLRDDKENFSILPIVGTAGVGKTTLARHLYNHIVVEDRFDLRVWIWVSDDFDIFKISKSIFQAVSGENRDFEDLNLLQIALKEKLKNKRFLLVLDDVWNENIDDWKNLVLPFQSCAPASRIIMTTQKDKLLIDLGFDHLDRLEILSYVDALRLFALHAVGENNFNSRVTYKVQAEGIVKKCGGSPLALKVLGRLMNTKTTKEEWDEVLNSKIWDLENVDEITRALRLSYYDLSSDLKRVFAYCSLFPKQFLFDKEELVLMWMAEGFLNQSNGTQSPEQLGHEYFKTLLSRSFFQSVPNEESLFMMHGLMNDLATFVAGDFYLRFDNHTKMEKKASTKHRHISFIREKYVGYQKFEAFKRARGLRTLLAVSVGEDQNWSQFYLSNKILVDLLPELRLLRVLSLSYFEISEVPEFVGNLKHLRYLNLTQTKIKELPESVGTLYSLETLIVFGCKSLTKLPKSFLNLKKLRHFDMRDTPLKKMPLGIGKMKNMRTLTKIIIEGDDGFAITELKELKNLRGKIFIEGLHEVKRAMHAREAQFSSKMITELEMKWIDKFDGSRKGTLEMEVLDELKPQSKYLKGLGVVYYGATEFPNWVGDPSFDQLTHVSIRGCKKCKSLPPLGQLPSLKKLFIQGMDDVKVIGSKLTGSSLQILGFEDMSRWEVWSCSSIQSLEELRIKNCPKLIDVASLEVLPSLKVLQIHKCGEHVFSSLAGATSSVTELEIGSIKGLTYEAWRGVIKYFGAVEKVSMWSCNEIRYLWESEIEASKVFMKLKELELYNCSKLLSLGKKVEDDVESNFLSSLRMLQLWGCGRMVRSSFPNSIESLRIISCSSLKDDSLPTTMGGGQKIKDLYIRAWANMKSIIQLSNYVHLTSLSIEDCPRIDSVPDLENLNMLNYLTIINCRSLDYSFTPKVWPLNLVTLGIGGLKTQISEWGPQEFPTSLVSLHLYGEHAGDFSQLSFLLPSSLTKLSIENFDKLQSLSVGLQHLTSLQRLFINQCPKMKYLPKTLLPPLLSLTISESPKLSRRCNGKGSYYWPHIYHIPCIRIQNNED